jgi:uncharacterized repeat protein (TIGR03803 family)
MVIALAGVLSSTQAPAQVVTVIHSFAGGPSDGQLPVGALIQSGLTLYGTTSAGGATGGGGSPPFPGVGSAFSVNTDGSNFNLIHSFGISPGDGLRPIDAFVRVGSTLYGMTQDGGSAGHGTIFKMNTDGSNYSILHSFAAGSDGDGPFGSLVLSGSTLYGMTNQGGAANLGTIFKINTDGSNYGVLHSFAGGAADGANPYRSLTLVGTTLFGVTAAGGAANLGTVFSIGTSGSNFTVTHSFAGGAADGSGPAGRVLQVGSVLYGTTANGGTADLGTVYRLNFSGSIFSVLHSFTDSPDGRVPDSGLTALGTLLYGTTYEGGANYLGTIYSIGMDGSNFGVDYSFGGPPADGEDPRGDLLLSGSSFYGMTSLGGANNHGTVFSFTPVPEPSTLLLTAAGGALAILIRRRRKRAARQPDAAAR